MSYIKTDWNPGIAPGISDANLLKIEDKIVEIEGNYTRLSVATIDLATTSYIAVGSTPAPAGGEVFCIVAIFKKLNPGYIMGELHYLYPYYGVDVSEFYTNKPDLSATTRYPVFYQFADSAGNRVINLKVDSNLVGYSAVVIWLSKEG